MKYRHATAYIEDFGRAHLPHSSVYLHLTYNDDLRKCGMILEANKIFYRWRFFIFEEGGGGLYKIRVAGNTVTLCLIKKK